MRPSETETIVQEESLICIICTIATPGTEEQCGALVLLGRRSSSHAKITLEASLCLLNTSDIIIKRNIVV